MLFEGFSNPVIVKQHITSEHIASRALSAAADRLVFSLCTVCRTACQCQWLYRWLPHRLLLKLSRNQKRKWLLYQWCMPWRGSGVRTRPSLPAMLAGWWSDDIDLERPLHCLRSCHLPTPTIFSTKCSLGRPTPHELWFYQSNHPSVWIVSSA